MAEVAPSSETFARVRTAYDLDRMAESRVVYVGLGGAASFAEDLARTGVGQHVLIDPDVVSETNLATQQTYRRDLGRPKVDCLAERILDINPAARVRSLQTRIEDVDVGKLHGLITEPLDGVTPRQVLLCGLTDSFWAQARVNQLALHFGVPSLCAQVYHEGRGAEVTFTFPGVTTACHRCVLRSRYEAYLDQGYRNDVTSAGTAIFSCGRLNSLLGFITLALLHHGTSHPRWGDMLERIGKRNLVMVAMDPEFGASLGLGVFEKVLSGADRDRLFFDQVVWLPQEPDCPENGYLSCPDCGGSGDLRAKVGDLGLLDDIKR